MFENSHMKKTKASAWKPRKTPMQRRARETVDAILEATARILVKHGWAHTNTNAIAEKAGVSVGTLYQYFPNKESLIVALNERHAGRAHAALVMQMERCAGKPLYESVAAMVHAVIEVHMENPELERMLETELSYLDVPLDGDVSDESVLALQQRFLEQHRKEIAHRDLKLAARVAGNMLRGLVHTLMLERTSAAEKKQRERAICDAVVGYLTYHRPSLQ